MTNNNGNGSKPKNININVPTLNIKQYMKTPVNKPSQPFFTQKPPQIIAPSSNHLQIDCIRCKGRVFNISAEPLEDGSAGIRELICVGCNKIFKVDPNGGRLGGFTSIKEN